MYTTLSILKQTRACTPGFGRLLAFFGTSIKVKHQQIPLHVIALIGGITDADWAVENSLLIDEQQFNEFRNRTLVQVWKHTLQDNSVYNKIKTISIELGDTKKPDYFSVLDNHLALLKESTTLSSVDQIDAFITRCSFMAEGVMGEKLWSVLDSDWLKGPQAYIKYILEHITSTVTSGSPFYDRNKDTYCFIDNRNVESKGELFAKLLKPEGTYKFIQELVYKTPRGMRVKKQGGKTSVVIEVSENGQTLFQVLNMLNTRGPRIDKDEYDDTNSVCYVKFDDWTLDVEEADVAAPAQVAPLRVVSN